MSQQKIMDPPTSDLQTRLLNGCGSSGPSFKTKGRWEPGPDSLGILPGNRNVGPKRTIGQNPTKLEGMEIYNLWKAWVMNSQIEPFFLLPPVKIKEISLENWWLGIGKMKFTFCKCSLFRRHVNFLGVCVYNFQSFSIIVMEHRIKEKQGG